jgi:hypothetical protein
VFCNFESLTFSLLWLNLLQSILFFLLWQSIHNVKFTSYTILRVQVCGLSTFIVWD